MGVTVTVYFSVVSYNKRCHGNGLGCVALGALIHSEAELLSGWHSETYVCAQKDTHIHTQIHTQALDNKLLQFAKI